MAMGRRGKGKQLCKFDLKNISVLIRCSAVMSSCCDTLPSLWAYSWFMMYQYTACIYLFCFRCKRYILCSTMLRYIYRGPTGPEIQTRDEHK